MEEQNKQQNQQQIAVDVNLDTTPILYTDIIFMSTNKNGLILDIAQKLGPTNKLRIVSRVGMSREHAKEFIKQLGDLIALTEGQSQTGRKS